MYIQLITAVINSLWITTYLGFLYISFIQCRNVQFLTLATKHVASDTHEEEI